MSGDSCVRCASYREVRGPRIRRELAKTIKSTSVIDWRFERYMDDYHQLHVALARAAALEYLLHRRRPGAGDVI